MDKKYKINKGFIVQKIGKKMTIFDPEESVMYTFNETAAFIFSRIKKSVSKDEIVEKLIEKYEVDAEIAKKDVEEVIEDLVRKRVLLTEKASV